jgi:uncharacterized protein
MHVDVSEILHSSPGTSVDFKIDGEKPDLENVKLTQPLSGHISISKGSDGLLLAGSLQTSVELECDRCLRTFSHKLAFPVRAEYASQPTEDELPIEPNGTIELDEAIRQEILVHLPAQQLCNQDCEGIIVKQEKDSNGSS